MSRMLFVLNIIFSYCKSISEY